MTDNEKFYDDDIAPALREISKKCEQRGMSLLALVEYDAGERGRTTLLQPDAGLEMIMATLCAKAGANIDSYMIGLSRYCHEKGIDASQSIVMRQLRGESLSASARTATEGSKNGGNGNADA